MHLQITLSGSHRTFRNAYAYQFAFRLLRLHSHVLVKPKEFCECEVFQGASLYSIQFINSLEISISFHQYSSFAKLILTAISWLSLHPNKLNSILAKAKYKMTFNICNRSTEKLQTIWIAKGKRKSLENEEDTHSDDYYQFGSDSFMRDVCGYPFLIKRHTYFNFYLSWIRNAKSKPYA